MKFTIVLEFTDQCRETYIVTANGPVEAMRTLMVDWTLVNHANIFRVDAEVDLEADLKEELDSTDD